MENSVNTNTDLSTRLSNLAIRVEGKGHYNIAKYLRATIDAMLRKSAFKLKYETSDEKLLLDFHNVVKGLEEINFDDRTIQKLKLAGKIISNNELAKISEFPEPIVCRRCGFISNLVDISKDDYCRVCGADIDTFVVHYPIYWMRQFDPIESLAFLIKTPARYLTLLEGVTSGEAEKKPGSGGWSILEVIKHIKDANGVLNMRVKLILGKDNPSLEFKKVWSWADKKTETNETLESILHEYTTIRNETIGILENITLKQWWRPAVHEEFGTVNLKEQVSYFAAHELTHIRQIVALTINAK